MQSILVRTETEEFLVSLPYVVMFWKTSDGIHLEHDGNLRNEVSKFKQGSLVQIEHQNPFIVLPTSPNLYLPLCRVVQISNSQGSIAITYRVENRLEIYSLFEDDPKFILKLFQTDKITSLLE